MFLNSFLVHSFWFGIYITFIYDIIRIIRRVIRHGKLWISIEDLCFWIYCGIEIFLLLKRESNGILRWYAVAGALTGMLLYRKLISRFLIKYVSRGLNQIKIVTIHILKWLWKPFGFLMRVIRMKLKYVHSLIKINRKK